MQMRENQKTARSNMAKAIMDVLHQLECHNDDEAMAGEEHPPPSSFLLFDTHLVPSPKWLAMEGDTRSCFEVIALIGMAWHGMAWHGLACLMY